MHKKYLLLAATVVASLSAMSDGQPANAQSRRLLPPPPDVRMSLPTRQAPAPARTTKTKSKAGAKIVTVATAGPYVIKDGQNSCRFVDYVDLKPGVEARPLTMTLTNNGFSWFRVMLSNQVIATEKNMGGRSDATFNMLGTLPGGISQMIVTGGGRAGSSLSWRITTPGLIPHIDKVNPDECVTGDTVAIQGSQFSLVTDDNQAQFNKAAGTVLTTTAKEMKVKVPENADAGKNKVKVVVDGTESNEIEIIVRKMPELTSTNLQGCPPGYPITIFGKNFSKDGRDQVVYIGDTTAEVTSSSETQITIIAPNFPAITPDAIPGPGHTARDIRVKVGKIMSKNSMPVVIGPQMFQDPGFAGGPDVPTLNPGF